MAGNRGLTPVEWLEGLSDLEHSQRFAAPITSLSRGAFFSVKEDHGSSDYNPVCHWCIKAKLEGGLVE